MVYTVNPKSYRLEHEIKAIERRIKEAKRHFGKDNPAVINNYKEMIRSRRELIHLLEKQDEDTGHATRH